MFESIFNISILKWFKNQNLANNTAKYYAFPAKDSRHVMFYFQLTWHFKKKIHTLFMKKYYFIDRAGWKKNVFFYWNVLSMFKASWFTSGVNMWLKLNYIKFISS